MKKVNNKIIKLSFMIMLCVFSMILFKTNINAQTISWEAGKPGYAIFDKDGSKMRIVYWLKSGANYYCLSQNKNMPDSNTDFGATRSMSSADSAAILYIINNAPSTIKRKSSVTPNEDFSRAACSTYSEADDCNSANISSDAEKYLKIQLGIWYYLDQKIFSNNIDGEPDVTSKFFEAYDGFETLYAGASSATSNYVSSADFKINTSGSFNPILNADKTKYESGFIDVDIPNNSTATLSISGVTGAYVVNQSGTRITTISSDQKIQVIVPAESISTGTTTINLKIAASKSDNRYVKVYEPSSDSVQSVGVVANDPLSKELTKSFTITKTTEVKISKQDATTSSELPGATLKITDSNNRNISCTIEKTVNGTKRTETLSDCTWVSGTASTSVVGLAPGTYYLTETIAPDGYVLSTEKVKITINSDGTATPVVMKNALNKVVISKKDIAGSDEIPGATLEIQDENGEIVKFCTNDSGQPNKECKWVSTDEAYEIEGMPNGTYYLVETIAPDGYVLNREKIKFIIDGKKAITNVVMKNALNKVSILKVNSADKKGLAGASLEIQNEEGEVVKFCTDANGQKNKECKWISTDKAYEIEGMPNGTYYLVETAAPKGYELNKEKQKFIVDGLKEVVEVEMVNELEVEVPSTLGARSALLLAIAMFDIALGIGILTYVKRNKITE